MTRMSPADAEDRDEDLRERQDADRVADPGPERR